MSHHLNRRRFLYLAGGATAATATAAAAWAGLLREQIKRGPSLTLPGIAGSTTTTSTTTTSTTTTSTTTVAPTTTSLIPGQGARKPVLVIVQMAGGNDGLNTLVPLNGRYQDARPTLALGDHEMLELSGNQDFALHSALAPLLPLWETNLLTAVTGIGIPGQGRSHFTASDSWHSGRTDRGVTGWLGRWLDATASGPVNPLRAVSLGGGAPILAAQQQLSTVIHSPQNFNLYTPPNSDGETLTDAFLRVASPLSTDPILADAQQAIFSTFNALAALETTAGNPSPWSGEETYTTLLDTAANLINLDLGTEVIVVSVHGFDTHSYQRSAHEELLTNLADGLASFHQRLEADGHADRVLTVTTSEFGRRLEENGSAGTDHGTAGTQFIIGPNQGIIGQVDLDNLVDGDVPIYVDTRSMYATALDWLGGPTDEILGQKYDRLTATI